MKIAISGKGGVGKSTIAAALSLIYNERGQSVLAVDADPDANLAAALGIPESEEKNIITIARHRELIEERTGAKLKEYGQIFKLNPEVSDIADRFSFNHKGINLLVLGAIEGGGTGCACPESALLKNLVNNLVLHRKEMLIMDMEAGIEHLGRSTAMGIDLMIVVVEPGKKSIDSAHRIVEMAGQIGITKTAVIASKVHSDEDLKFITDSLPKEKLLGWIPFSREIIAGDRDGLSALETMGPDIIEKLNSICNDINTR